jgi:hypothetical protein
VRSTAALLETGLDLGPRTLVARVGLEVGEPGVQQSTIVWRDRDVFVRERVPKRCDEFKTVTRTQLAGFFQQVGAHGESIRRPAAKAPNGWRLSGDGGEADGVRCSRGLGALAVRERKALGVLNGLHRKVHVQIGPEEVILLRTLDVQDLGNRSINEPRELPERYEELTVSQEQPKSQR